MTNGRIDPAHLRQAVRDHYGRLAHRATDRVSCCEGDGSGDPTQLGYTAEELAQLPPEATNISLGCGSPLQTANLQRGETVLDLGAGGGIDVLLAARRVGPSGFVYGLDMTEEMVMLATRNAQKAGVTNVRFIQGLIEAIPLPDASVDVIISNCVLNLVPDKRRAFGEMWRVLKPSGRIAVSDIVIDGGFADLPVSEEEIRSALSWTGCLAGALSVEDYIQALQGAGFAEMDITIKSRYYQPNFSETLNHLTPEQQCAIFSRICSADITAVKPK